jgi:hypothetical protein
MDGGNAIRARSGFLLLGRGLPPEVRTRGVMNLTRNRSCGKVRKRVSVFQADKVCVFSITHWLLPQCKLRGCAITR